MDPAFQGGFQGSVGLLAMLTRLLSASELTPLVHTPQQNTAGSKVKYRLEKNRCKKLFLAEEWERRRQQEQILRFNDRARRHLSTLLSN